eukprot:1388685-Amphidinium_carterae.1
MAAPGLLASVGARTARPRMRCCKRWRSLGFLAKLVFARVPSFSNLVDDASRDRVAEVACELQALRLQRPTLSMSCWVLFRWVYSLRELAKAPPLSEKRVVCVQYNKKREIWR